MEEKYPAHVVPVDQLRWNCDPDSLGVNDTTEAQHLEQEVIAQERAVSALKFGMAMGGNDYNIFVAGEARTGLSYIVRSFIGEIARKEPSPSDWCYVHSFKDPDNPRALSIPKGMAREFAEEMDELVKNLQADIPAAFESDSYRHRRDEKIKKFNEERNQIIASLEQTVNEGGFVLNVSQQGMMIIPAKEGQPLTEEYLKQMTDEDKAALREKSEQLQEEMNNSVIEMKKLERKYKAEQKELERRVALHAVGFLIDELQEKYQKCPGILQYLVEVKNDVIMNLNEFKGTEQPQMPMPFPMAQSSEPDFTRYNVHVIIDNTEVEGAPIVYETNPTYLNLFGSMERKAVFGALFTDFTMIRPGSIHRANGGYLVIQARDLLKWFISWEALKRALQNKEIRIEDQVEMLGVISTKSMKPEPIPLKVKIILIGEPYIYHLLYQHDEQFMKLFKVKAHLDDKVDRAEDGLRNYIAFAARMVEQQELKNVDKTGLARLLEYGVEVAGRQKKLTLKMALIRDILREADYWAQKDEAEMIARVHVDKAIRQRKKRSSLPEDKMQEFIQDGYMTVDTAGKKVGQINGLSVFDLGDYMFGRPSRITASVSLGRAGVAAIDRESKLSGNIHTKGVLIMEGYLKSRYAQDRPLSLSASLVFEQSYGMVDGDSASAAELYTLLSALSGVPLRQDLAVTGAISQLGEIQPIGGVNQKIEGFFEVCQARGFTGEQGVMIPQANVQDLMLKGQVIDAVKQGLFRVYAVKTADEALEILTGLPAGERGEDGEFPEGSFNRKVEDKLKELEEKARKLKEEEGKKGEGPEPNNCDGCQV